VSGSGSLQYLMNRPVHYIIGMTITDIICRNYYDKRTFRQFCSCENVQDQSLVELIPIPPIKDNLIKQINSDQFGYQSSIKYDFKTKQPKYTYERFVKNNINMSYDSSLNSINRKGFHFYSDSNIKVNHFRVRPKDYNDSKYDRGHMIPAADMNFDDASINYTFSMANISPQVIVYMHLILLSLILKYYIRMMIIES